MLSIEKINHLESENAELRKYIERLSGDLSWHCVQCTKECKNLELQAENNRLKAVLQEIKEIAENCYDTADKENDEFYTILQIITKAEEE